MFKNIEDLNKIEIISNGTYKIYSMISTFENCTNLNEFEIYGFDYSDLKSMKKLLNFHKRPGQLSETLNKYVYMFEPIRVDLIKYSKESQIEEFKSNLGFF